MWSDSLNTSLESLDDFLDEFDGKGDELSDLIDNLNDSGLIRAKMMLTIQKTNFQIVLTRWKKRY